MREVESNPWIVAAQLGTAFFSLVGVVLSIASLRAVARGNRRATVCLILCALPASCFCTGLLLAVVGFG